MGSNLYSHACHVLLCGMPPDLQLSSSVHSRTAVNNQHPIKFGSASGWTDEFLSRLYLSLIGGYPSLSMRLTVWLDREVFQCYCNNNNTFITILITYYYRTHRQSAHLSVALDIDCCTLCCWYFLLYWNTSNNNNFKWPVNQRCFALCGTAIIWD